LLAGYADTVSIGQHAFVGVGAYGFYGFAVFAGINPFVALLLAGLTALIFVARQGGVAQVLAGAGGRAKRDRASCRTEPRGTITLRKRSQRQNSERTRAGRMFSRRFSKAGASSRPRSSPRHGSDDERFRCRRAFRWPTPEPRRTIRRSERTVRWLSRRLRRGRAA
jgi:hypothetical protein